MRFLVIVCVFLGAASALPAKVKRDAPYPAAVPFPVPHETYGPPTVKVVEHTEDCAADGRWIDDVLGRKWSGDEVELPKTPETHATHAPETQHTHTSLTHAGNEMEGKWTDDVTGRKWNLDETDDLPKTPETYFVPVTHAPETHNTHVSHVHSGNEVEPPRAPETYFVPVTHAPETHHNHAPHTQTGNTMEGKWTDDVTGRKWNLDETDDLPKTPETYFVPVTHAPETHYTHAQQTHTGNVMEGKWTDDVTGRKWNLDEPSVGVPAVSHATIYNTEYLRHDLPHVKYDTFTAGVAKETYGLPLDKQTNTHDENCETNVYDTEPTKPYTHKTEKQDTTMYGVEIKYEPIAAFTPTKPETTHVVPETPYVPVTHTHEPTKDDEGKWTDDVTGRKWNVDDTEPTKPHTPEPERPNTKMYEVEIQYAPYAPAVAVTPTKPQEEYGQPEVKLAPYPAAVPLLKPEKHDVNCETDDTVPTRPHAPEPEKPKDTKMYDLEVKYETPFTPTKPHEAYTVPETPHVPVTHTNEPTTDFEGKWKDDVTGLKWNVDGNEPAKPHTPAKMMYEVEIKYEPYAPAVVVTPTKSNEEYGPPEVKLAPYPAATPLVKETEHDENCETDETQHVPETPQVLMTHTTDTDGKWTDDVTGRKWNVDDTEPAKPHTPEPEKQHTKMYEVEIKYAPYAPAVTVTVAPPKPHEEYDPPEVKLVPYPAAVPLVKETVHDENCEADGRWINDLGKNYDKPTAGTVDVRFDNLPKLSIAKSFFKRQLE